MSFSMPIVKQACLNREDARNYGSSFTNLWQLWSHNYKEKEWGRLQSAPGKPKMEPTITVTRKRLQAIDKIRLSLMFSVYMSAIDD